MFNHGDVNSIRMVIRGAEVGILAGAEDIIMEATLGMEYGYGGGWGGGWNNGWGGNPYMNGYQAGYYNGYYNAGYNNGYYNGYYNGGYNNGYGDYSQQQNYSYYGPRKQSGAAGSNTTDGQIKRAEG
jgi:hypothetical protein